MPVSVEVTDAESPISALKFNWSASAGTFSGSGRQVTWNAPASVPVPSTVTLNLEVVEPFTYQGRNVENKVAGSTTVSLHNSTKEVGDMARQFLLDFSDSSIKDLPTIMRNFEPTCPGTTDETYQVSINRRLFNILSSSIGESAVTLKFGGTCPFRNRAADACVQISAYWKSAFVSDNPESNNKIGDITEASGTDQLTAFYYRNQRRWRLCDSDFNGTHTLRKVPIGLVP